MMKRQTYLDILRVLAIFLVIVIHVCAPQVAEYKGEFTYSYNIGVIFDSIARCSVPIFVMISGALLLNSKKDINYKDLYIKKILRLLIAFIFFRFIYFMFIAYLNNKVIDFEIIKPIIKDILMNKNESHFWFMYMIIGLYIIYPLIKKFVNAMSKKELIYFSSLAMFFSSIVPLILQVQKLEKYVLVKTFDLQFCGIWVFYFILGYVLSNIDTKKINTRILMLVTITMVIITTCGTFIFTHEYEKFTHMFFDYSAPNIVIYSVCIFILIKKYFKKVKTSELFNKLLLKISELTFGIYLTHMFYIKIFTCYKIKIVNEMYLSYPIVTVIVFSMFIFILSFVTSYLISKIPIVNKYLIYYTPKKHK